MQNEHSDSQDPTSKASLSAFPAPSASSVASKKRKLSPQVKYYAVKSGHIPGVYLSWRECQQNIAGFKNAIFKSFLTRGEADAFVTGSELSAIPMPSPSRIEKFYGVANGRIPGVYSDWATAQEQVRGWKGPKFKKFATRLEAEEFVQNGGAIKTKSVTSMPVEDVARDAQTSAGGFSEEDIARAHTAKKAKGAVSSDENLAWPVDAEGVEEEEEDLDHVTLSKATETNEAGVLRIHTDGSSQGNGQSDARAGLGVYFGPGDSRNVSERLPGLPQTNQRAELAAILRALEICPTNREVHIFTDSRYSIDCVTVWYKNWERNKWQTSVKKPVSNKDLVQRILARIKDREALGAATRFFWIKGHSNDPGNEAADRLAVLGAQRPPVD